MRERDIEGRLAKAVKESGGMCPKFVAPGFDGMKKPLEIRGWSMDNGVGGWAAVEVEDMEEYKDFMKDYKEIKRAAKNWIRFGF